MHSIIFFYNTRCQVNMPRITEELVRRRAEHNEGEISSLEELSLHQQDIEKIEHLDRWCKELKILYLQNNLIPKIENVSRLKQLQYLNLALNNITRIENLEGCEFLQKLDLTVNFVGDLQSVASLRHNQHLRELYLTGNPCTDFEGYREFVVGTLPQLASLDGREVSRSERILALQKYEHLRRKIENQQKAYELEREVEREADDERRNNKGKKKKKKKKKKPGFDGRWYTDTSAHETKTNGGDEGGESSPNSSSEEEEEEEEERFWNEPVAFTPESRVEAHQHMSEQRKAQGKEPDLIPGGHKKRTRRLEKDGKMLNVNEGRYNFNLTEDEGNNCYVLEVDCPRFMDTSLMECDIQPSYVRLTLKGKVLQLVLQEEVSPDQSTAKRSQTTGQLLVTMPKVQQVLRPASKPKPVHVRLQGQRGTTAAHRHKPSQSPALGTTTAMQQQQQQPSDTDQPSSRSSKQNQKQELHQFLEVDPTSAKAPPDIRHIVKPQHHPSPHASTQKEGEGEGEGEGGRKGGGERAQEVVVANSDDFVDDPEVPPLI